MEMDVAGRGAKLDGGVIRGSVWETRMRVDQVKGGIKVFGIMEQDGGGDVYSSRHEKKQEEEVGEEEADNMLGATPLKRIGVRGGKRRTWQPQPETFDFDSPIRLISEKPERSPIELANSRSEPTDGPPEVVPAESKKGKFEFLQRAGQRAAGDSGDAPEDGSLKKFIGSPVRVVANNGPKRSPPTVKSIHNDQPKKPPTHSGQFKIGPKVCDRNDGVGGDDEEEDKFFDIKEISVAEHKSNKTIILEENKVRAKKILFRDQSPRKPISPDPPIKQQPPQPSPVTKHSTAQQRCAKESLHERKHDSKSQKSRSRDLSLSDLVMWRNGPKSAIVFGLGTLFIISSSFLNDPSMCFISTISYMGLACLSAMFLYRSIIWRGYVDIECTSYYEFSGEDVLCLAEVVLPYLNDFIRKLRALLSGDPATTMKLAVVLFVLARYGSFVTMWNMIKLGFFMVFTVPKLWSLYSTQLTDQGRYWRHVSEDAWDSCPHKKTVAGLVIVLVLGLSSNFARIWAGFMLLVAFRYYQQGLVRDGCSNSDEGAEEKWEGQRRQHRMNAFTMEKKAC